MSAKFDWATMIVQGELVDEYLGISASFMHFDEYGQLFIGHSIPHEQREQQRYTSLEGSGKIRKTWVTISRELSDKLT
jgi:hypothetical protein